MRKIRHYSQRRRAIPLAVSESETKTIGFVKKPQCYWDKLTDRYIKKLKATVTHKAWLSRTTGLHIFNVYPEHVKDMQKLFSKRIILSDIDLISELIDIAKKALNKNGKCTTLQLALFKKIVEWETIAELEDLRESVDDFHRLLNNPEELEELDPPILYITV